MIGFKLKATITPEQFPFIESPLTITDKKGLSIRSGYITFYVISSGVIAIKKSLETTNWAEPGKWETITYEIKTKVEII